MARSRARSAQRVTAGPGPTAHGSPGPDVSPPDENSPGPWRDEVRAFKRRLLATRLAEHRGNRAETARSFRISRTYLFRLLRELEADVPPAIQWRG